MTKRKWVEYRAYDGELFLGAHFELPALLSILREFEYVPRNQIRIVAVEIIETVEEVAEVEGVEVRFMSAEEAKRNRAHLSAIIDRVME